MARKKSVTVDLKVRMKEPLRAKIEAAAKENGVSLNAEAVARLERSFQKGQADERVRRTIHADMYDSFEGKDAYDRCLLMALAANHISRATNRSWLTDKWTFIAAMGAWETLLSSILKEPDSEAVPEDWSENLKVLVQAFVGPWQDRAKNVGIKATEDILRRVVTAYEADTPRRE